MLRGLVSKGYYGQQRQGWKVVLREKKEGLIEHEKNSKAGKWNLTNSKGTCRILSSYFYFLEWLVILQWPVVFTERTNVTKCTVAVPPPSI
jgi:hypothetical protein